MSVERSNKKKSLKKKDKKQRFYDFSARTVGKIINKYDLNHFKIPFPPKPSIAQNIQNTIH